MIPERLDFFSSRTPLNEVTDCDGNSASVQFNIHMANLGLGQLVESQLVDGRLAIGPFVE